MRIQNIKSNPPVFSAEIVMPNFVMETLKPTKKELETFNQLLKKASAIDDKKVIEGWLGGRFEFGRNGETYFWNTCGLRERNRHRSVDLSSVEYEKVNIKSKKTLEKFSNAFEKAFIEPLKKLYGK